MNMQELEKIEGIDHQGLLSWQIIHLIKTIPGERLGQPAFGSNLHTLLFEPMNEDFGDILEDSIRTSMETWLPYINIKNIEITFPDYNINTVNIAIDFGLSFEPDRFETVSVSFDQFESSNLFYLQHQFLP